MYTRISSKLFLFRHYTIMKNFNFLFQIRCPPACHCCPLPGPTHSPHCPSSSSSSDVQSLSPSSSSSPGTVRQHRATKTQETTKVQSACGDPLRCPGCPTVSRATEGADYGSRFGQHNVVCSRFDAAGFSYASHEDVASGLGGGTGWG